MHGRSAAHTHVLTTLGPSMAQAQGVQSRAGRADTRLVPLAHALQLCLVRQHLLHSRRQLPPDWPFQTLQQPQDALPHCAPGLVQKAQVAEAWCARV